MKTRFRAALGIAAVAAVSAVLLSGCVASEGGGIVAPSSAKPHHGGTVTVGVLADVSGGLDPHKTPNQPGTWLMGLIYNQLIGLDKNLRITPELAESWTVNSPTSYTFHLRHGVTFTDGSVLNSADVKISLERLMNPKTGSAKATWYKSIASVDAPDGYTVVLTLSSPDAVLLTHLANPVSSILSDKLLTAGGDPNVTVIGSGPFKFESQTPGVAVELSANPNYFEKGIPYLDHVTIKPLEDENTRNNALKSGDIDIATTIPVNLIDSVSQTEGISVTDGRAGQFYNLGMMMDRPPFNDVRVRQAVMNVIDRDVLVKSAIFGKGVALKAASIPPWSDYALDEKIYPSADLKLAQKLLHEANFHGADVTMGLWSGQTFAVNAGQIIQEWLKPLGINVKIVQYGDYASYNQAVFVDKKNDMTIQGFGGKVDPADWLDDAFRTGNRQNYFGYSNPEVDNLLTQAMKVVGLDKRKPLYDKVQRIVAKEGPMAFLFNMQQPDAVAARVKNYQHRPDLQLDGLMRTWVVN